MRSARHPTALSVLLTLVTLSAGCGAKSLGPSRPVSAEERLASFKIGHDDFAKIGYRLDWIGFPYVDKGEEILFIAVYDDIVATVEGASTVSVLDADTGQSRWQVGVANRLTRFVGIARVGNNLLVSSDTEFYLIDIATGNITDRQSLKKVATTAPMIMGELVLYGTSDGQVTGHLHDIGLRLWGNQMQGSISQPVVLMGEIAATASESGEILFVDRTGRQTGRTTMHAGPGAAPTAGGGLFFVGSLDQSLYAFEPDGAGLVWRYRTQNPITDPPRYHDGVLYCATVEDGLIAFRAASGTIIWNNTSIHGEVVSKRGNELLIWDGKRASTIDIATGDLIEQVTLPRAESLWTDRFEDGNLYVVSKKGAIGKFNPRR